MDEERRVVPRYWVLTLFAVLILCFTTAQYAGRKLDPREPFVVRSSIPFIGHILGMIASGGRYTKSIACKHYPIFTMPMPGSRIYIIIDPALAATAQKTKSLSFNPIIPQVTQRVLGLNENDTQVLRKNIGREESPDGFYPEVRDLIYGTMTPGDRLDDLTAQATDMFRKHIEEYAHDLRGRAASSSTEDLLLWTQHIVTMATADFLYGPQNPVALDPSLESSFWDFDHGLGQLLAFAGLMPHLTARKAFRGREAVVKSMLEYFEAGHHKVGSPMIQERCRIAQKYGMTLDGIARSELSFLFAGIVNTAITSFWAILHVFARPDLLAAMLEELKATPDLDPQVLATSCPLLLSVYRETLRLGSDNSSNRLVTSDTLLADQYFLAKGSVVQISGAAMHMNSEIWGEDVATFDPYRFTPNKLKVKSVHPSAFRAFGGGTTICPGRHFAMREILYFVALVLTTFDVESLTADVLEIPEKKDDVLPVHILEPSRKVMVRIRLLD